MYRFILLVSAGALLAPAQIPVSLWLQVAMGPPGTNNTTRTDVIQSTTGGVATGGTPVSGPNPGVVTGQPNSGSSPIGPGGGPVNMTRPPGVPTVPGLTQGSTSGAPGSVPATTAAAPSCEVHLVSPQASVGENGGIVDIAIAPLAPGCQPPVAASGTWLQLAKHGVTSTAIRFSAAPNTTPYARTANVVIGERVFTVEQAGLIRTRLAAAPGRLVVGMDRKNKELKRQLTVWADDVSKVLKLSPSAPWIQVHPGKTQKDGRKSYAIIVDASSMDKRQKYEGTITVTAEGAAALEIPVIVEGIRLL